MAASARASFVPIAIRPPRSVGSNRYWIASLSSFMTGTPGGTFSWMSIGASKSPSANIFAMWVMCARISSRLFVSAGSFASASILPPGARQPEVVRRPRVVETHDVDRRGSETPAARVVSAVWAAAATARRAAEIPVPKVGFMPAPLFDSMPPITRGAGDRDNSRVLRWKVVAAPLSLLIWASYVLIVIAWTPLVFFYRLATRRSDPDRFTGSAASSATRRSWPGT